MNFGRGGSAGSPDGAPGGAGRDPVAGAAGEGGAVELHAHGGNVGLLFGGEVDDAFDVSHGGFDVLRHGPQRVQIIAKNLNSHITAYT